MAKRRKKSKSPDLILIILAIFLPFIAVLLKRGLGLSFLISILLCCLGYIPGILYGLWVITR